MALGTQARMPGSLRLPVPGGSGRVRAHPRRHWRPVPSSVRGDDRVARLVPSGLQRPTQFQGLGELVDKSSRSLEARVVSAKASSSGSSNTNGNFSENFFNSKLPNKILQLLALIAISRAGVYIPLPGVDTKAFAETLQGGGLLSYIDTLSGGSISKVGVFSLGIVPYINASIVFQLLTSVFPSLKAMQREDGQYGRKKFERYQKTAALGFAVAQGVGQCLYVRPFVDDFSFSWLVTSGVTLTAGAAALIAISDEMGKLKLGNGTSLLIFVNIASSVPTSVIKIMKLYNCAIVVDAKMN